MKASVIPQVRIDPGLRAELETALMPGETLPQLVEASGRRAAEVRSARAHFYARGQAAWENYERSGIAVPAEAVLARLQAKLEARRAQWDG